MLPELLYEIFTQAWLTAEDQRSRWGFFCVASLLSHACKAIMTSVALHNIFICTELDLQAYRKLAMERFGGDESTAVQRLDSEAAQHYFKSATLFIVLARESLSLSLEDFKFDFKDIHSLIPYCRKIHIFFTGDWSSSDVYRHPLLFEWLALYQDSAPVVHFTWSVPCVRTHLTPTTVVPGIRYLRIQHLPRCTCERDGLHRHTETGHERNCLSHLFPTTFPDLVHLHLDTPYILRHLALPPTCARVEIEAPPIYRMPSRGHFSSLFPYNVAASVRAGFLQFPTGRADRKGEMNRAPSMVRRAIIVNTGPDKPDGWERAASVCKERNIELVYRHTYSLP